MCAITEIRIPQVNVNDTTVRILRWYVDKDEYVESGDILVSVETSKAVLEINSPGAGFMYPLFQENQTVEVGSIVAFVAKTKEDLEGVVSRNNLNVDVPVPRATDKARRLAEKHGVELASIQVDGIITEKHVMEQVVSENQSYDLPVREDLLPPVKVERPLTMVQKAVAQTVTTAKEEQVSTFLVGEAKWDKAVEQLRAVKQEGIFLSPVDLFVFFVSRALESFPLCNAMLKYEKICEFSEINIGVTVDIDDDLFVVVIHQANKLSVSEIAVRRHEYQLELFRGNVDPKILSGGTFSVSLLERQNLIWQVPIIYPNQAAILGVGGAQERPVIGNNGDLKTCPFIGLSLSYDHRFVNGAYASSFMQQVASLVEECRLG